MGNKELGDCLYDTLNIFGNNVYNKVGQFPICTELNKEVKEQDRFRNPAQV